VFFRHALYRVSGIEPDAPAIRSDIGWWEVGVGGGRERVTRTEPIFVESPPALRTHWFCYANGRDGQIVR